MMHILLSHTKQHNTVTRKNNLMYKGESINNVIDIIPFITIQRGLGGGGRMEEGPDQGPCERFLPLLLPDTSLQLSALNFPLLPAVVPSSVSITQQNEFL